MTLKRAYAPFTLLELQREMVGGLIFCYILSLRMTECRERRTPVCPGSNRDCSTLNMLVAPKAWSWKS